MRLNQHSALQISDNKTLKLIKSAEQLPNLKSETSQKSLSQKSMKKSPSQYSLKEEKVIELNKLINQTDAYLGYKPTFKGHEVGQDFIERTATRSKSGESNQSRGSSRSHS